MSREVSRRKLPTSLSSIIISATFANTYEKNALLLQHIFMYYVTALSNILPFFNTCFKNYAKKRNLKRDYVNLKNFYLQWYDQHKEFLFLVCENMLYEIPSCADKYNSNEENSAFQEMSNVI